MECNGKELKQVLNALKGGYPEIFLVPHLAKDLSMDQQRVTRVLAYSLDKGWVALVGDKGTPSFGPYRMTAYGIDKVNAWTGDDDALRI